MSKENTERGTKIFENDSPPLWFPKNSTDWKDWSSYILISGEKLSIQFRIRGNVSMEELNEYDEISEDLDKKIEKFLQSGFGIRDVELSEFDEKLNIIWEVGFFYKQMRMTYINTSLVVGIGY